MAKIDGLEIVMTKQMQKMIDKELKKRFEELKPELATRYEELLNMRNMETNQFNDGFNDARAGKLETDHPHYDFDTDNWRLGYAWGMFETMKEKLAREHQVSDALYLLLVDDPNTKLKAEQILIDIYGKCEPSPSDISTTQDVLMDIKSVEQGSTEPDFDKMPIKKINQYLLEHGYDPEKVGLRGKILVEALTKNIIAREIIQRLLADPGGCRFCDFGVLRKPDNPLKGHDEDCPYLAARAYLDNEISVVVKRDLSDAEIEELGAQEAEKRGEK